MAEHWTLGTFTFVAGHVGTLVYQYTGTYRGLNIATPEPRLPAGGNFVATAQGIRNVGTTHDPWIQYVVTIENRSGFTASFSLRIDILN